VYNSARELKNAGDLVKRQKEVKLYNMLFPMYLLWLVPTVWIIIIPANFIIDSIVVLLNLTALKLPRAQIYKKAIFKVWGYGFLADLIGSIFLFIVSQGSSIAHSTISLSEANKAALNNFRLAVEYNPYSNFLALAVTLIGIAIAGICIYFFNLKRVFKNSDIDLRYKKRLALMLAIFTAPYMLLIPANQFF
jgi:hypothetical protein